MTQKLNPETALWWQKGIIYQVYPRSFQDSNEDGIGDLDGVTNRLDYLVDLGIDAIWLSPFFKSPMKDFGYDVSDYTDIDPIFGDLAAFDRLISAAHARDIRIIIDYVPNHSSDQHVWFAESRSSRDNPKRDWYIWRDPKPDGSAPNNWLSHFGGRAWTLDPQTGQYYLHSFLKEQPDLNWRNPGLKKAMLDVLCFWLDRDVDGFRMDVANFIMKDPDFRDLPPNPSAPPGSSPLDYGSVLHIYDRSHPDVHGVFREMRALLNRYSKERPRYSVGETHVGSREEWASYYGNNDELHMPFNFGLVHCHWDAPTIRNNIHSVESVVAKQANLCWPNYVLGNHDEHRIASRAGIEQAGLAMMLLLTLRGTPTMYYGDEIGMENVPIPYDKQQDPYGINVPGKGRDLVRTPMQWDTSPNGGFCAEGVTPWLPLADNYRQNNVVAQDRDPNSMLNLTRLLIRMRRETPALSVGSYTQIEGLPDTVIAYIRQYDHDRRLIALNFSAESATLPMDDLNSGNVLLSTRMDRAGRESLSAFHLRGNEGCILSL